MDTLVREVWTGCWYCLNPRHPGPCAKPGSKAYEKRHGKAKDGPKPKGGGGSGSFEDRASKAATGPAAAKAAPYNRQTESDLTYDDDDFGGTGVSGDKVSDAAYDYGDNGYAMVNNSLRSTGGDVANPPAEMPKVLHYSPKRVTDMTTGLDAGMAHSKLDRDVVVHRGVSDASKLFGHDGPLTGLEFRDHGYVSTTTAGGASGRYSGNKTGLEMRILVPKGTGAMGSQGFDTDELVLDRGLKFKVRREYDVGGVRTVDVEVMP